MVQIIWHMTPEQIYHSANPLPFAVLSQELARRLLMPWKTFTPIMVSPCFSIFELGASIKHTNKWTDRQTDKQDLQCGLLK